MGEYSQSEVREERMERGEATAAAEAMLQMSSSVTDTSMDLPRLFYRYVAHLCYIQVYQSSAAAATGEPTTGRGGGGGRWRGEAFSKNRGNRGGG